MAKYVELIDKYRIIQSKDTDYNPPSYEWVDNTGEIVRCEDCKHWDIDWVPNYAKENEHFCPIVTLTTRDDWFCADGEKKEEN